MYMRRADESCVAGMESKCGGVAGDEEATDMSRVHSELTRTNLPRAVEFGPAFRDTPDACLSLCSSG